MNKIILFCLCIFSFLTIHAQTTILAPGEYKSIDIGNNGHGDYTHNLILLHEIYNGTNLDKNYAVGKITAFRGNSHAFDRIDVAEISSSSSYMSSSATLTSVNNYFINNYLIIWKLKTCIYNGKKYLAVDVPYADAHHDWGFKFVGWTASTAENMKSVAYMVGGTPVNENILSDIQDYTTNISETHMVHNFNIMGNVGIGTISPQEKLSVNGKIRAKEVKVETTNWPDYVFKKDFIPLSLLEIEKYIIEKGHLPGMPSAKEVEGSGLDLGDMNSRLLQKIEELTLLLIEQNKKIEKYESRFLKLETIKK